MSDHVPVYDEDGNLKHYQTSDPEFNSVQAKDSFTDPGGKVHTGKIGGGGGGMSLLAHYGSDTGTYHDQTEFNGIVLTDGSNITLHSSQAEDGDFLLVYSPSSYGVYFGEADGADIRYNGSAYQVSGSGYLGTNSDEMAWLVWNESDNEWDAAGSMYGSTS